MFNKNLTFYRLKKNLTKKELAKLCGLTPMSISHYEAGDRTPDMDTMEKMAQALDATVADFLKVRNDNLQFKHGEFRKNTNFTKTKQEYVRESVEEYFARFYTIVEILGGEVLPPAPHIHELKVSGDMEIDSQMLRKELDIPASGPIGKLITLLENKGILIYEIDIDNSKFMGMNGTVQGRPYIVINKNMTAQRKRTTIAHELAHMMFVWPDELLDDEEKMATAIAGAFLLPQKDAVRELGPRRTAITNDMKTVCIEYGIAMTLLVKRASQCHIINESIERGYYIFYNQSVEKKDEDFAIDGETAELFKQLVYRGVAEDEISVQKGAELLQMPFNEVAQNSLKIGA